MFLKAIAGAILPLISYTHTDKVATANYQKEARVWVKKHLHEEQQGLKVSVLDLQLIANLCYFSFERSRSTLEGQKEAMSALTTLWNGWQNIAHTRLDPSKKAPHDITEKQKTETIQQFWTAYEKHQFFGQAYAYAVESLVHGNQLESANALKAVQEMRDKAQTIVATTLADVRKQLGTFLNTVSSTHKRGSSVGTFSWLTHLWNYVPQLAISSFVQAEDVNNKASQQAWNLMITMQEVGCQPWQELESARASFYLAHYQEVLSVLKTIDSAKKHRRLLFCDTSGFDQLPEIS